MRRSMFPDSLLRGKDISWSPATSKMSDGSCPGRELKPARKISSLEHNPSPFEI